jgi:2-amino-4-hydroxy-6-hydroxymethyldihydropteridine diphosphokinase
VTQVAVALGSNLGDRDQVLRSAVAALSVHITSLRVSLFHETMPVGMPGSPEPFLNAAVAGETALSAHALLETLLAIEQAFGRQRPHPGASRTLDLDLILYGDAIINEPPRLLVPHPRFRHRRFVLEPLAEVAPGWIDPLSKRTIAQILSDLES